MGNEVMARTLWSRRVPTGAHSCNHLTSRRSTHTTVTCNPLLTMLCCRHRLLRHSRTAAALSGASEAAPPSERTS
jgi:hypothetical protein